MTRDAAVRLGLRSIAVAVALGAAIDPSITTNRRTSATAAVVVEDSANAALGDRVAAALSKKLTVVRSPRTGTDATVVIGDRLPEGEVAAPAFFVTPDEASPRVSLVSVRAPSSASLDARITVEARIRVRNAKGQTVSAELQANGAVVDRVKRAVVSNDDTLDVPLNAVPTTTGSQLLNLTATAGSSVATADALVDVGDRRWAVLFYDARPSWISTFVRRAIEHDSRFSVAGRTVTSRGVSTDVGAPPARLNDLASMAGYDVVVVGAPEALAADDVSGLETFLRRRGGSVVLLMDQPPNGVVDRLTGVAKWSSASSERAAVTTATRFDSASLAAREVAWPATLPADADVLAGDSSRAVVWRTFIGAGELIVSGALDAWRFRDPSVSTFDRFWQAAVANAAAASPRAVDVRIAQPIVRPGAIVAADAELRDILLRASDGSLSASASASVDSVGPIGAWPEGPGRLAMAFRAPRRPGRYRLLLTANGNVAQKTFVVAPTVAGLPYTPGRVLAAWASAHGGTVVPERQLAELATRIRSVLGAPPRLETWHPMRSGWWIIPFVLALGGEWWLRRRRGLR